MSDRRGWHIKDPETQRRVIQNLVNCAARGKAFLGKLTVPTHAHPLVRRFFELLNEYRLTLAEVSARSGVHTTTFVCWRRSNPQLPLFAAALNAIGHDLKIVRLRRDDDDDEDLLRDVKNDLRELEQSLGRAANRGLIGMVSIHHAEQEVSRPWRIDVAMPGMTRG